MKLQITDKRKDRKSEKVKLLSLPPKRKTKEQKTYDEALNRIKTHGINASNIKSILDIYDKNEKE